MRRFLVAAIAATQLLLLISSPVHAVSGTTLRAEPNLADQGTLGTQADLAASAVALSGNGRYLAFRSSSTNLVVSDTNGKADVFVHDGVTRETERVSVTSAEAESAFDSQGQVDISSDGRFVSFGSLDPALAAGTGSCACVYVRDRLAGTTERVTGIGPWIYSGPTISDDGNYLAFATTEPLVVDDVNGVLSDVYLKDRSGGGTSLVSVVGSGASGNHQSFSATMNGAGTHVVFSSDASNLVAGDTNGLADTFVRDLSGASTARVSIGDSENEAESVFSFSAISDDGLTAIFTASDLDLVPGGTNGAVHVFARDIDANTTELISVDSDEVQAFGNQFHSAPSVSADGRYVAFESNSTNPLNSECATTSYVRDRVLDLTAPADFTYDGARADCPPSGVGVSTPTISSSGRVVGYLSSAANLVAGDTNDKNDAFRRDLGDADSDGVLDPFDSEADTDNDGMPNGFEAASSCLDQYVPDSGSDTDADDLTALQEFTLGTNPCVLDTDADGCADGEETGLFALNGGLRDPTFPWDFYDVNGTKKVDVVDIAQVRAKFDVIPPYENYAATHDRSPGAAAWAPAAPDGVINAVDIGLVRAEFNHSCQAPPN